MQLVCSYQYQWYFVWKLGSLVQNYDMLVFSGYYIYFHLQIFTYFHLQISFCSMNIKIDNIVIWQPGDPTLYEKGKGILNNAHSLSVSLFYLWYFSVKAYFSWVAPHVMSTERNWKEKKQPKWPGWMDVPIIAWIGCLVKLEINNTKIERKNVNYFVCALLTKVNVLPSVHFLSS